MPKLLLIIFLLLHHIASFAQKNSAGTSCDSLFFHQADSVKVAFAKEGYRVLKETPLSMESEYEVPVVVPLTQGMVYRITFIGDFTSKLYEVRMYDWDEKMVVYQKKQWGEIDGNIISYTYAPQFSEYHMIKPVQVNKKKKKLCGYVILFAKTHTPSPE